MTIFALSTVEGQSGVAIIRVSGPLAVESIKLLTGKTLSPRVATLCKIQTASGEIIDESIVLFFKDNESFTGEAVAEFHLHGSIAIINAVLRELEKIEGLRHAKPGEFTKQAYLNGKINLKQVEGLATLIQAETEEQRKQAINTYINGNSEKFLLWLHSMKSALAYVEASIDFADEEIPKDLIRKTKKLIIKTKNEIKDYANTFQKHNRIKDGIKVVILGIPNSGKSTLINYLSKKEIAIVSKKAGTTRDILHQKLDIKGIPVTIYDTAGLRKSKNDIETEGNVRALNLSKTADIKIFIGSNNLKKPFGKIKVEKNKKNLVIINKSDLKKKHSEKPNLTISLKDNKSLDLLWKKLENKILNNVNTSVGPHVTSEREYSHVVNCLKRLDDINYFDISLASEDIKAAINEIEAITMKTTNDDILDIIFNEFCIGK